MSYSRDEWRIRKLFHSILVHFRGFFCILGVIIAVNNCLLTTFAICRLPSFVPILKWQQKIKRYFTPCLIIIGLLLRTSFFQRIKQRSDYAWMTIHKNHRSAKQTVYYHLWFVAYYTSLISYLGGFVLFNNQTHEKMRTIKRT